MTTSITKKSTTRKPAAAKAPEDRKPKASLPESVDVVVRGVSVSIDADILDDFELVGDMALMDENPAYTPRVLRKLVGDDKKYAELLDAVRDDRGKVSVTAGIEVAYEILEALNPSS